MDGCCRASRPHSPRSKGGSMDPSDGEVFPQTVAHPSDGSASSVVVSSRPRMRNSAVRLGLVILAPVSFKAVVMASAKRSAFSRLSFPRGTSRMRPSDRALRKFTEAMPRFFKGTPFLAIFIDSANDPPLGRVTITVSGGGRRVLRPPCFLLSSCCCRGVECGDLFFPSVAELFLATRVGATLS